MQTIIRKIRDLLNDNYDTQSDLFTYYASKIFTLTQPNALSTSIIVYKNGVVWANTNYSFNSITNKLTVTGTIVSGNTLEIFYSTYKRYSDNVLSGYIGAALTHLSVEQYKTFTITSSIIFPTPSACEENLIALIASILIIGTITSYKTPELTITFAETDSVSNKIQKTIRNFNKAFGTIEFHAISEIGEIAW